MTRQHTLAMPAYTQARSKSVGTLVPMALRIQRVDAQDMNELRRMTCPEGQLYENCPNLKALAAACRNQQHGFFRSALDINSTTQRRHSDDGADGRGRAYWLRLAKSHLLGGYHQLRARLSPTSRSEADMLDEGRRHLIVEFLSHEHNNNSKKKCKSSDDINCVMSRNVDFSKPPNHNMSSCLVIHSLKEGRLTAEISLEGCLDEEDLVVRVQNYTLEILTQKKMKKGSGKSKDAPSPERTKCGQIDIPIYLDPGTLWFDLVDNQTLIMEGDTKTSLPRNKFHSHEELNSTSSRSNSPRSRSPFERRQSNATWYINNTQTTTERPSLFRQRSYTR